MSRSAPAVELPPIAATNKCLAQNNKPRRVIRATKDANGHWTVGTAEGPLRGPAHPEGPTDLADISLNTGWTAKQADALCNCAQDNGWPHPMRIADLLKLSDTDLHYMPQVGTCTLRIIREARQMAEQER